MADIIPAEQSPFDGIKHVDAVGAEYWLARELQKALGYGASWQNFTHVIEEAKTVCQSQGYNVAELFNAVVKKSSGGRPGQDYYLTRHACYMVALSADGTKDEVAAAKTYFAVKTREREEDEARFDEVRQEIVTQIGQDDPLIEVIDRIRARQELTEAHKKLFVQARLAGVVTKRQFAVFMNWGYRGQYYEERENDIHARKELREREDISSFMGGIETTLNRLRSEIATREMRRKGDATPGQANRTHYDAGKAVRDFALSYGIVPEKLTTPAKSYRQIVKEEAERFRLEEESERGLWRQLPEG